MPEIPVPKNVGKVRVAIGLGYKWTVWNGKQGKGEFTITCRDRKQAERLAEQINKKQHDGKVVLD